MSDVRIPPAPVRWSALDYRYELELARFSRASYLEERVVRNDRSHPDHGLFDREKPSHWRVARFEDCNDTTGFVAYAFVNEAEKRVVIAIRGSDNAPDWAGPNTAVSRDGELLDMLNLPSPGTGRTRAQMARLQETLLPGDAWDPQFRQALDFAQAVRDEYAPHGYRIEATGHSMGGAHAQMMSHTFGWDGRSFDAPGAANVAASKGYLYWLAEHGVTPAQAPRHRSDASLETGFLNYKVNNSAVSHKTGPHLGDAQSISSLEGRQGFGAHARYTVGIVGGGISETPLAGQLLKATGAGRIASLAGSAAHVGQHGVDALDRHDMDRIVAVFEEAVRRQDRGDRRPLPIFGERGATSLPPLAGAGTGQEAMPGTAPERQRQAVRALIAGPDDGPLARFLDAVKGGDAGASSKAARDLANTPEAQAWLEAGRKQLLAIQGMAPAADRERSTQETALHTQAQAGPAEQAMAR